jgi:hypothetical protein
MGDALREKIKSDPNWRQLFGKSLRRVGSWTWPRPDYIVEDAEKDYLLAIEFKPPACDKREYVTGFGQAVSYLNHFEYCSLIVPSVSGDGYEIAQFLKDLLTTEPLKNLPISLVSYEGKNPAEMEQSLKLEIALTDERVRKNRPAAKAVTGRTFWAFWRDMSNYEVYELLNLSDRYSTKHSRGNVFSDHVWPKFHGMMMGGRTRGWEGQSRQLGKKGGTSHFEDYKKNYKISLFHLGLWEQSDGKLTRLGYRLLNIGRLYGPDSSLFINFLAQILLTEGKHLDLINQIDDFQVKNPAKIGKKSDVYRQKLESYFDKKGLIKRNPRRTTTAAKLAFIRDEPKIWNKLGLLHLSGHKYFVPRKGYLFNWQRITDILREDFSLYG